MTLTLKLVRRNDNSAATWQVQHYPFGAAKMSPERQHLPISQGAL
jgi:hypothetical protein